MKLTIVIACVLPIAAAAQDMPVPRLMKDMGKGEWRMEVLEHSQAKQGQKMPAMNVCTDNLMKQAREHQAAKDAPKCKQKLLKDAADEAVMETTCPDSTITTTMKKESSKSELADVKSTGKRPMTMKMRYTHVGACKPGQQGATFDKDSDQCRQIQAQTAQMDPKKQCAGQGGNQAQCEQMVNQQIARAKAMCGG